MIYKEGGVVTDQASAQTDTLAVDTIAGILNENDEWSADELDAIAAVLDVVRGKTGADWNVNGPELEWAGGRYVVPAAPNADSVRLVFEVQYDADRGEDMGSVLAAVASDLLDLDGVTHVRAHGPSATVINDLRYDVFVTNDDEARWERGTAAQIDDSGASNG